MLAVPHTQRRRPRGFAWRLRALGAALLFACVLAAETFAAAHAIDSAAHAGGEPCKICVGVAGFAGAVPSSAVVCASVVVAPARITPSTPQRITARRIPLRPASRAPPFVS